jgi:hypothetical protein
VLPSEEYVRRLKDREQKVSRLDQIHIRLGNIRLVLAIAAAIIAWLSFRNHLFAPWWLLAPILGFGGVAVHHSKILLARSLAERAVDYYKRGLARIEDRWSGTGETGERFDDPHHVYASDLDLFGEGGLFQLLSTARTRMGEERLVRWLLAPSPVEEIRERHECIAELRDQVDLREDISVLGQDIGVGVHPEELQNWSRSPNLMKPHWIRTISPILAAIAVAAIAVWGVWGMFAPLITILVIEAILTRWLRRAIDESLHGTEHAFRNLDLLSGVLARIETQQFRSPKLLDLQNQLSSSNLSASQAIARLRTLVDFIESRHNTMVRIIDVPLMYSVQVAFAAESWRRKYGSCVASWIEAAARMEALLSLAAYSYEHPADPLPEFVEGKASFQAQELGHPLVPAAVCIRNDVSIDGNTRVLLVSGSNMSGKSTLLRAVGINVVLAMAGAPVRARHLRLSPLQVGASIRINDSLREGSSRFYAEITRLRQILDLTGQKLPLIFLLDELLQGTNSNDRRLGAEGILRALVDRGAIGLISTHDLALTEIAGLAPGALKNVHFQDELAHGKMSFDYILRDGIVTKSNGLELMRSVGLDV